ncbi:ABC transporter ATP-binding protein [Mycolicibacterium komossense]|uniref:Spermidine/putrescine import ATP-binding protein PotA n=1 Tax=Mycolicibacterium komossense TaxID=1779 RepID=A0ABT3CCX3_9MYCO|nr:ABC transporter ATP-binding protein [Mycolicibacterium komossense]MCV7227320.1 ABC transporter ATP-binding protein [Mycolicibacterium komossense]
MSAPAIRLSGVTKSFGDTTAVQPTDLEIGQNEFFSILGPSGCGKTTLMRMIAGFETPTSGTIELAGVSVTGVPTRKRDLNMVFQSYALFPHLSVADNVAFELQVKRVGKAEVTDRVTKALKLVRLEALANRKPAQLSGGQRQRVALARAIVGRPTVILLDEPLGALDQQLRKEMQVELKRLQREVHTTFVYVTHDQEEALTMSDRIAVMSAGRILQIGSPTEIYERPTSRFVASFIGSCNVVEGARVGGDVVVPAVGTVPATTVGDVADGAAVGLAVRPERISITTTKPEGFAVEGALTESIYTGDEWRFGVSTSPAAHLVASVPSAQLTPELATVQPGGTVWLSWRAEDARALAV